MYQVMTTINDIFGDKILLPETVINGVQEGATLALT